MPKVPAAKSLMPVAKKTASKPVSTPKLVFKKGVTNLAEVLAYAADQEGIWVKDVPRFKDLREKYSLPLIISETAVEQAHRLDRKAVQELIYKYKRKEVPVEIVETKKTVQPKSLVPPKPVAKKMTPVKKSLPPPAKKSVAPIPQTPLKRIAPKKGIAVVKKSIKS